METNVHKAKWQCTPASKHGANSNPERTTDVCGQCDRRQNMYGNISANVKITELTLKERENGKHDAIRRRKQPQMERKTVPQHDRAAPPPPPRRRRTQRRVFILRTTEAHLWKNNGSLLDLRCFPCFNFFDHRDQGCLAKNRVIFFKQRRVPHFYALSHALAAKKYIAPQRPDHRP